MELGIVQMAVRIDQHDADEAVLDRGVDQQLAPPVWPNSVCLRHAHLPVRSIYQNSPPGAIRYNAAIMQARELTRAVGVAARAARAAGALLARRVGQPSSVGIKRHAADLVTELDRASERMIRQRLRHTYPDVGFLGEEQGARQRRAPARWIVDPLDGTMNFVHGVPLFGVSIALEHRGALVAGVVYDPMREELFQAARGQGAWLNGVRLRVSCTHRLGQSLLATGFSSRFRRHPAPYLAWFRTLESQAHAVRRLGTTVLSLAYVAAGRLEAFYERDLWPWDIAAGIVLVEEAGGCVSNFSGAPVQLSRGQLLASNGRTHRDILRILHRPSRPN
jgi:myo-inositol-1(or 4)-monophosphatase